MQDEEEETEDDGAEEVISFQEEAERNSKKRGDVLFPKEKSATIYVLKSSTKEGEDVDPSEKNDETPGLDRYGRVVIPPQTFWKLTTKENFARAEVESFAGTEDEVQAAIATAEGIPESFIQKSELFLYHDKTKRNWSDGYHNHGFSLSVPIDKTAEILSYLESTAQKAVSWVFRCEATVISEEMTTLNWIRKIFKGHKVAYGGHGCIIVDRKWIFHTHGNKVWFGPGIVDKLIKDREEILKRRIDRRPMYRGANGKPGYSKLPMPELTILFRQMEKLYWSRTPRYMQDIPKGHWSKRRLVAINEPCTREGLIWAIPRMEEFVMLTHKKRDYRGKDWFNAVLLLREKYWEDPAVSGEFRQFLEKEVAYARRNGIKRIIPKDGEGKGR